jgi:hypothetical protein
MEGNFNLIILIKSALCSNYYISIVRFLAFSRFQSNFLFHGNQQFLLVFFTVYFDILHYKCMRKLNRHIIVIVF